MPASCPSPPAAPQRERVGWTGDIQVFAAAATNNAEVRTFLARWLRNLRADQLGDGRIPIVSPFTPRMAAMEGQPGLGGITAATDGEEPDPGGGMRLRKPRPGGNAFGGGQSTADTAPQVTIAGVFGVLFGAMYFANGSIWPVTVLHAAYDGLQLLGGHQTSGVAMIVGIVIMPLGSAAFV